MRLPLTTKEKIVYDTIVKHIKTYDYSPTLQEVADTTNLKSRQHVFGFITQLKKKGYIKGQGVRGLKIV
ncbi:MAG: hypothetical protein U1E54_03420 [Candidatus Levybacteria bacterium]|nr:hypothetical protein [Candidatus Levybacteria bacterium]